MSSVLNARLKWYAFKKDSLSLLKYHLERIDRYGIDTVGLAKFGLNNIIYHLVFKHSNDTSQLNRAIGWMELLMKTDPEMAG